MSGKLVVFEPKNKIEKMFIERADALVAVTREDYDVSRAIRVVSKVIYQSPALANADPTSLFLSVSNAMELGLDFSLAGGQAYIVPFGKQAQLVIGYRGWKKMVLESGFVTGIDAQVIYEGEVFEAEFGDKPWIRHAPNPKASKPIAAYAIAKFTDGHYQPFLARGVDIERARKASRSGSSGPWASDPAAMMAKTAVRRLVKYLPETPLMVRAAEYDEPEVVATSTATTTPATGGLREALTVTVEPEPQPVGIGSENAEPPPDWELGQ